MKGNAYWISPRGELKAEPISHIKDIIKNPRKFGFNRGDIAAIYKKHGEKIGVEGKSREEIIIHLLGLGWIRIREYPNMYWSVNIERMGRREMDRLQAWAESMLRKGKDGYMPVKITMNRGGRMKQYTVREISQDVLFTESRRYARRRYTLIEVNEFSDWDRQIITEHFFLVGDNKDDKKTSVEEMDNVLQRVDERSAILIGVEKY